MEGREREDPKLLLNQGPSEPCYATGCARCLYTTCRLSAGSLLTKSLSVSTFQPPISRWMWVSHYQSVSVLDFVGAKDGEGW